MAKKRTLVPFYGKKNQRLDAAAAQATREGRLDDAKFLRERSRKVYEKRIGRS